MPTVLTPTWYVIDEINPEPWTASEASAGRKDGKFKVTFYKNPGLEVYQNAIKADLALNYPDIEMIPDDTPFALEFYFSRQLEAGETERRKVRRNRADATNMQKALEDALQGVLYSNDRNVAAIRSQIVEQGPNVTPCILIGVSPAPTTLEWMVHLAEQARSRRLPRTPPVERYTPISDDLF